MTYTVTCPDPECKTTFEVEEDLLELDIDEPGDPLTCPGCEQEWEWDFDADHTPPLVLTELATLDEEDWDDVDDEEEGIG